MGLLDDLIAKLGLGPAVGGAPAAPPPRPRDRGITVAVTRDLRPPPATGVPAGHLVEVHAVLDEARTAALPAAPAIRVDVREAGLLSDDLVVALVGTGATAPAAGPSLACTTVSATVDDRGLGWTVEQHRRTTPGYERTILVATERDPGPPASGRAHVVAWTRAETHDDVGSSELVATVDIGGGGPHGSSAPVDVVPAVPGVAVRVTGVLTDAELPPIPLVTAVLPDVTVTLGGRTATSGPDGRYAIDARLPVGDSTLGVGRPGVTAIALTVAVAVAADGRATATVRRGAEQLATATTPAAGTATSLLGLPLPELSLRVGKLRGTVLWPDSRIDPASNDFRRTPLAGRRVYVLPLADGPDAGPVRPATTRAWEDLKLRAGVLRSARPDQQPQGERTGADGRFEVRYVDLTPGRRHLIWVERFDGDGADPATEAPEHLVRTADVQLRRLQGFTDDGNVSQALTATGRGGPAARDRRRLVDREHNLAGDRLVSGGPDVLTVEDRGVPAGVVVAGTTVAAAAVGVAGRADVDLVVLPVVPLGEPPQDRGRAARQAADRLAADARAFLPDGHDLDPVRVALDVARLVDDAGLTAGDAGWTAHEPANAPGARLVALLENTFLLHGELGAAGVVRGVERARWHSDAVTAADSALVLLEGGSTLARRTLGARTVVPLFAPVVPLVAAAAPRRVYLGPGHGLWPLTGPTAATNRADSDDPDDWRSNRGGYAVGAGEDETDALWARATKRILERSGTRIHTCRELDRLAEAGVSNPAAGQFAPVADPDFPRLWQQNPVYAMAAGAGVGNAVVMGTPAWTTPAASAAESRKNNHGIDARLEHIRRLARQRAIDLVICPHTNGGGGRGTVVEYLNAHPAGQPAVEGNDPGRALSDRTWAHLRDRCRLPAYLGGVATMATIQPQFATADLVGTFEHWSLRAQPPPTRERFSTSPAVANQTPQQFNALYETHPFPDAAVAAVPANTLRLPVAIVECGFHDDARDAPILARNWFRQRAAEAVALGVAEQLGAATTTITADDVRAVLARLIGITRAVDQLPAGPVGTTPADRATALDAVLGPRPPNAPARPDPGATLGAFEATVRAAAASQTREELADALRTALAPRAGWNTTSDAPADIARWVREPFAGASLARPGDPVTRAEAAELACRAVGGDRTDVTTAESRMIGPTGAPLLSPAGNARGALFPPAEVARLVARCADLRLTDVHHVTAAELTDGRRVPLDTPRGSGGYALDRGTAVTVVARTAGAAWRTVDQLDEAKRAADAELRLTFGGRKATVPAIVRQPTRVASGLWTLDWPTTTGPLDLQVDLWLRLAAGWTRVGGVALKLHVLPPAP